MSKAGRLLRSPRLALVMLSLTLVYAAAVSWLPWLSSVSVAPPSWAVQLGLDHPFRSLPFLASCLLLFLNTCACTWVRLGTVRRLWLGELPPYAAQLEGARHSGAGFLKSAGFRERGGSYFRNRFALWGGLVLHVGILAIILSVAIQQAFCDGGSFEVAEGEMVALDASGVVFSREAGRCAAQHPPRLRVALDRFDPFLHQEGYAPDRLSRLVVIDPSRPGLQTTQEIDRAGGLSLSGTTIYQAIPTGIALNIETAGAGVRSLHLRETGAKTAAAQVTDPSGAAVRFVVEAERPLNDPKGTGELSIRLEGPGGAQTLSQGVPFSFGPGQARILAVSRWGGFTYARTPGIALVFAGFAVALAGCFLLLFPAGVARLEEGGARVYLTRGSELLLLDWNKEYR